MCYFVQEYIRLVVELASFNNLSVNYSRSCTSMYCCFALSFVMLPYVSIDLDLLPLRYVALRLVPRLPSVDLFSGRGFGTDPEFLFVSFHPLSDASLSLSLYPLLQLLYPTPHHRSCYRLFPVFYREFTGARSVPREHRQEHQVREDQGPNLLSRDLLRTTPPPNAHKCIFQETSHLWRTVRLTSCESACAWCLPLAFN